MIMLTTIISAPNSGPNYLPVCPTRSTGLPITINNQKPQTTISIDRKDERSGEGNSDMRLKRYNIIWLRFGSDDGQHHISKYYLKFQNDVRF